LEKLADSLDSLARHRSAATAELRHRHDLPLSEPLHQLHMAPVMHVIPERLLTLTGRHSHRAAIVASESPATAATHYWPHQLAPARTAQ
jgi:hypothetical protein